MNITHDDIRALICAYWWAEYMVAKISARFASQKQTIAMLEQRTTHHLELVGQEWKDDNHRITAPSTHTVAKGSQERLWL